MFVVVILAVLQLLVTVKLPENVLFTPSIRNPDNVLEWGTIFNIFPESDSPLTFPITYNISPFCVAGL